MIWGDGSTWGINSTSHESVVSLPVLEEFSSMVFGSDYSLNNKYSFKIDNIRFSSKMRTGTLFVLGIQLHMSRFRHIIDV
jgi:hypothetical protein